MATKLVKSTFCAKLYIDYTITQDITTNKSTIALTMYVTPTSGYDIGPWTDYNGSYLGTTSNTFTASIGNISSKTILKRATMTVAHNADGTGSATIYWKWGVNSSWGSYVKPSGSFTITLPTIPRVTTPALSAGTVPLGDPIIIYTPRVNDTFDHALYYSIGGSDWIHIASAVTTEYKWTIPIELANYLPNTTSSVISILCETYNSGSYLGSTTVTFNTIVPDTIVPTVTGINIIEATSDIATLFGGFVKSKSTLKITPTAIGAYGSTITSYLTYVDGVNYSGSSFTSNVIQNSGTLVVKTSVTDSRGRVSSLETEIIVHDYFAPTITSFIAERCLSDGTVDSDGTYIKFTYACDIAPVNNKNAKAIQIQFLNGNEWSDLLVITDTYSKNDTYVSDRTFSPDSAFQFRLCLTDHLTVRTIEKTVSTTYSLINYHKSGRGIKFGGVARKENAIELGMETFDRFDTVVCNGLAVYNDGLEDANTTLEHTIVTQTNAPTEAFYYVTTYFYAEKSKDAHRAQIALPYFTGSNHSIYYRYYYSGAWTEWIETPFHKVGSIVCTSTNEVPSTFGTWELIDKEFTPQMIESGNFTINTTNTTSATLTTMIAGHEIDLKLITVNKTAIGEDQKTRGTIKLGSIGVTGLPTAKGQVFGASDGANAWSTWTIQADGTVTTVDCDPSNTNVPAGNTNVVHWKYTISDFSTMIDAFCNKFYWKRTA